MAKKSKTFKIGEYAKGGIITAEISGKTISIIGKEWDYSKGSNRSSDQSGAKEFTRGTFQVDEHNAYRKIADFLCELTTSYYSDEVLKYITANCELKQAHFWA